MLVAVSSALWAPQVARAEEVDLSRMSEFGSGKAAERGYAELSLAAWLPGLLSFNHNHTISPQIGLEAGVPAFALLGHQLQLGGGLTVSPQTLEDHENNLPSTMVVPYASARYIPESGCNQRGTGCMYFSFGLGLAFEITDAPHQGPSGALTGLLGIGYRRSLTSYLDIGARIDIGYLEETADRTIGWFTPALTVGTPL